MGDVLRTSSSHQPSTMPAASERRGHASDAQQGRPSGRVRESRSPTRASPEDRRLSARLPRREHELITAANGPLDAPARDRAQRLTDVRPRVVIRAVHAVTAGARATQSRHQRDDRPDRGDARHDHDDPGPADRSTGPRRRARAAPTRSRAAGPHAGGCGRARAAGGAGAACRARTATGPRTDPAQHREQQVDERHRQHRDRDQQRQRTAAASRAPPLKACGSAFVVAVAAAADSISPTSIDPESPMKMRAGEKLCGRNPRQVPASAAVSSVGAAATSRKPPRARW